MSFDQLLSAANIVTMHRLCIGVWFLSGYGVFLSPMVMTVLLVTASVSDFLDGFLARWLQQDTPLGRLLDPVADAIFLLGVFRMLWETLFFPISFFVLLIMRYACCAMYFVQLHTRGVDYQAIWSAKCFAALLMVYFLVKVLAHAFGYLLAVWWDVICMPIVMVLYSLSWLAYYRRYLWYMMQKRSVVQSV